MRDVEELLRDTMTDTRRRLDPPPAFYDGVRRRATRRRHQQFAMGGAALAVVAVATTATALAVGGSSHRQPTPTGPAPASVNPLRGTEGTPVQTGDTLYVAADTIATSSALYVLGTDPSQVVKLDAAGDQVLATAEGPAGTPSGMAIDGDRLWVWSQNLGVIRLYDANSLQVLANFNAGGLQFFNGAAIDGELWLASQEGLYVLPASATEWAAAAKVVDTPSYSLAADEARHRVLVGEMVPTGDSGLGGTSVVAIDARSHAVTTVGATVRLGKTSIAIVGDQVWIGGYGSGDDKRIEHLDASTLRVFGSSPVAKQLGPGAILWSGDAVLWVRNGGDEGLSCVDPTTGEVLEYWDNVQGPITSAAGRAYAVVANVVRLNLNAGCTG